MHEPYPSAQPASDLPPIFTRYGEISPERYRHFMAAAHITNAVLGEETFVKVVDLSEQGDQPRTTLPEGPTPVAIQGDWVKEGSLSPFWRAVEISEAAERGIGERIRTEYEAQG